jgi:uncharacterized protein with FMN-binding domain
MRKTACAALAAGALAIPVADASAAVLKPATPVKKKVVTKTVTGTPGSAGRWGDVQVTLVVKKTTTTVGKKTTVTRKITKVNVPEYPNHTDRSVFINQQALPYLQQEELTAQFATSKMQLISGATDTSYAFMDSLQSALLAAKKV